MGRRDTDSLRALLALGTTELRRVFQAPAAQVTLVLKVVPGLDGRFVVGQFNGEGKCFVTLGEAESAARSANGCSPDSKNSAQAGWKDLSGTSVQKLLATCKSNALTRADIAGLPPCPSWATMRPPLPASLPSGKTGCS